MSSDQNPYEQMFSFVNEVFKNAGMDNSDLSMDEYANRGPTMPKEAMEFLFGNKWVSLDFVGEKLKIYLHVVEAVEVHLQFLLLGRFFFLVHLETLLFEKISDFFLSEVDAKFFFSTFYEI